MTHYQSIGHIRRWAILRDIQTSARFDRAPAMPGPRSLGTRATPASAARDHAADGASVRHTFVASYLKAGGDVLTLQRILGHTSLRMVNHYVHLAHSDVVARHRRHSPVDRLQLPRTVDRVTRGRPTQRRGPGR